MSVRHRSAKNIVVPLTQPLITFDSKKRKKDTTSPDTSKPTKRRTMEDTTTAATNNDLKEMEERITENLGKKIDQSLKEAVDSALTKLIEANRQADMHPAIATLSKDTTKVIVKVKHIESEQSKLKKRIKDLENRVLCNNLVLKGIPDVKWEEERETLRKVYQELSNVIDVKENEDKLVAVQEIGIRRCKRMGRYNEESTRPRPISLELVHRQDVLYLLENKKRLNKGIYLDKEYSQDVERKRKILRPILQAAKNKPKYKTRSRMEDDKVVIKGKHYGLDNLEELPSDLEAFKVTSRESHDVIGFFGELNPLSNFHPAEFTIGEKTYHCSEQYIQESKALFFNDHDTASRIMDTSTAAECKSIGYSVTDFNQEAWDNSAKEICAKGINEKFLQNPELLDILLTRTGTKTIIESSKDDVWGTGVALHNPNCLKKNKWLSQGQGIMGEILQELRDTARTTSVPTPGSTNPADNSLPSVINPDRATTVSTSAAVSELVSTVEAPMEEENR